MRRNDLVEGIEEEGQVFSPHQELVDLKQLVVGEGFRRPRYYEAVDALGYGLILQIDILDGVVLRDEASEV